MFPLGHNTTDPIAHPYFIKYMPLPWQACRSATLCLGWWWREDFPFPNSGFPSGRRNGLYSYWLVLVFKKYIYALFWYMNHLWWFLTKIFLSTRKKNNSGIYIVHFDHFPLPSFEIHFFPRPISFGRVVRFRDLIIWKLIMKNHPPPPPRWGGGTELGDGGMDNPPRLNACSCHPPPPLTGAPN